MNKDLLLTDFFPKIFYIDGLNEATVFRNTFEQIFNYSVQLIKIGERNAGYRRYSAEYEITFYASLFNEEYKEIQIKDLDTKPYYLNSKDITFLWENKHYLDKEIFVQLEQHFKKFDIIE